MLRRWW